MSRSRTFIVAEIGSVHDGSFGNAKKLIDVASECGANAVKFQTHIAVAETLQYAPQPPYFEGEPRYEYFERTAFTKDEWKKIKAHCESQCVEFLSSPFSIEAVELLEEVGVKRYKIPSGEVTNIPLLEAVAVTKKPVLLSSGMSSWEELDRAVDEIRKVHDNITVLQCTSEYPCSYKQVGLNVIDEMRERYKLPVGFSDHTLTIYAPLAAITKGITVLEKHFTLSRDMYGSDAKHSLEPDEFTDMVQGVRAIETMLESPVDMNDVSKFKEMKEIFQKSVVSVANIPKGTVITKEMVAVKKPGTGIPAARLQEVIGTTAQRGIPADALLSEDDFV